MTVRLLAPDALNGTHHSSLTFGKEYEVLGIEADWLRLLNDRVEPVLYDPLVFEVIDAAEPGDWLSAFEDGVRYAYPFSWGRPGFFEDWHDGVEEVRRQFAEDLDRRSI
jgi:uncharacterized protein YbjT (DUF2867 family)